MRYMLAIFMFPLLISLPACGQDITRSEYQTRDADFSHQDESSGLILSDSMKQNVGVWYRQTYMLWQADHKRLRRELKKQNTRNIRQWSEHVVKDLQSMQKALLDETLIEQLDKLLEKYAWIKVRGEARQNIGGALRKMDLIEKAIKNSYLPGVVDLKMSEVIEEPAVDKDKQKDKESDGSKNKIKPKW